MDFYGQIDATVLGQIMRQHPDIVKEVQFKDGTVHKIVNVNVNERQQPDQNGRTHYIRVNVKKEAQVQGMKYYIADLKPSAKPAAPQVQQTATPTQATPAEGGGEESLPF